MSNWVDYKLIKSKVTMEMILSHYGLLEGLTKKGDNLAGCCPLHNGSNRSQFHVSLKKNNYNCFGDCKGGADTL
jgi:DNA primase